METEINQAARAVAGMVVQEVKPLTVPLGSVVNLPEKRARRRKMRKRIYGLKALIAEALGKHPEGMHALQVLDVMRKAHPEVKWTAQNAWNNLSQMKHRGYAKNLNGRWYKGDVEVPADTKGGRPAGLPRTAKYATRPVVLPPAKVRQKAPINGVSLEGFDIAQAITNIETALSSAKQLAAYVQRREAQIALHEQQNGQRLAAILKLATEGAE